jgi:hypothetical protein
VYITAVAVHCQPKQPQHRGEKLYRCLQTTSQVFTVDMPYKHAQGTQSAAGCRRSCPQVQSRTGSVPTGVGSTGGSWMSWRRSLPWPGWSSCVLNSRHHLPIPPLTHGVLVPSFSPLNSYCSSFSTLTLPTSTSALYLPSPPFSMSQYKSQEELYWAQFLHTTPSHPTMA